MNSNPKRSHRLSATGLPGTEIWAAKSDDKYWRVYHHVVKEYMAYYHLERNHKEVGNQLLKPGSAVPSRRGSVKQRQRLGGMPNYYYREAA